MHVRARHRMYKRINPPPPGGHSLILYHYHKSPSPCHQCSNQNSLNAAQTFETAADHGLVRVSVLRRLNRLHHPRSLRHQISCRSLTYGCDLRPVKESAHLGTNCVTSIIANRLRSRPLSRLHQVARATHHLKSGLRIQTMLGRLSYDVAEPVIFAESEAMLLKQERDLKSTSVLCACS